MEITADWLAAEPAPTPVEESCPAWLDAYNEYLLGLFEHELPVDEVEEHVLQAHFRKEFDRDGR